MSWVISQEKSCCAAILVPVMAAEKQIDAAQKFLRGIQSLASYAEVRDKQAQGVQRSLQKVVSFTAAQGMHCLPQALKHLGVAFLDEKEQGARVPMEPQVCRNGAEDVAALAQGAQRKGELASC